MIQEGGLNGTVSTFWVGDMKMMNAKLKDG